MLGFGPLSSRAVSGSPYRLVSIALNMAASGALVTLGGNANGGNYLTMGASGALLTFGGSPVPTWTQRIAASGAFLSFQGSPRLFLAGKPYKITMVSQPHSVRQVPLNYRANVVPANFIVRRAR